MPSSQRRIIMPCPIVVPVEVLPCVEFLSVVLVGLYVSVVGEHTSEGVVMVHFLHLSVPICHHAVVSLMILQVVVVHTVGQGYISVSGKQSDGLPVFIDQIPHIVGGGRLSVCPVYRAELSSVGVIEVFGRTSVSECDGFRQI